MSDENILFGAKRESKQETFEAPCTTCGVTDAQHARLPELGTEVSVCRGCRTVKHQVRSVDSGWVGKLRAEKPKVLARPEKPSGKSYRVLAKVKGHESPNYVGRKSSWLEAVALASNTGTNGFLLQSTFIPPHRIEEAWVEEEEKK